MVSIKLNPELSQKLKTEQRVILTTALKEAIAILEMPLIELAQWLQAQIEQNPLLQFSEKEAEEAWEEEPMSGFDILDRLDPLFTRAIFPESFKDEPSWIEQIASNKTLSEYLLEQAREALSSPEDLQKMKELIGNLDEKGFLGNHPADPHLLSTLQSFDPPGIGARSLQEALLLQLERKEQKESLAYRIVNNNYHDLLHHNREKICLSISCTHQQLDTAIKNLSTLNLVPAAPFHTSSTATQVPDIFIEPLENGWEIRMNDSLLPSFKQEAFSANASQFKTSALWIEKIFLRRNQIITQITQFVLKTQTDFFRETTSDLVPLTLQEAARQLNLHESTVSRAVKEKYLSCPRGIFPLRFFFPQPTADQTISQHTAKEKLKELIHQESKEKPIADQELCKLLNAQGILCARRTVAKYRQQLHIPAASKRAKGKF